MSTATARGDGIEWEDDMVAINRRTTPANIRWTLLDRTDGATATPLDWRFAVGDRVKIRLVNEMDSDHPMHHPIHLHGAGRFLVLARDGVAEPNLVWKDTVLRRPGRPSTSCSTSPTPVSGWRTATSPSTCTAGCRSASRWTAERRDDRRGRWDSLRLFSPAQYEALPGMAFSCAGRHVPGQGSGGRVSA